MLPYKVQQNINAIGDKRMVLLMTQVLESMFSGTLVSEEWKGVPSLFRLRLTGTGTVTMDARDSLGNETLALYVYTVSGATDQIEFPYAGDDAVDIRVTLTGTATAEVI